MSASLALCDSGDNAVLVAPYYFSHKLSLQLSEVNVAVCPFEISSLLPQWSALEEMVQRLRPKMVCVSKRH